MLDPIRRLRENIQKVFFGKPEAVDRVVCCLLARGHVLIEDVPGVGKTVLATALARSLDCTFNRIQLTPDLLPSDVLGVSIYDRETGQFQLKHGPIFANIVLADEINRTTPRTQSAMLEAMSEGSVSIEGRAIEIEPPFMVVATQNPHEFEGTYPLPESQLDRFLMRVHLGYPAPEDEARVLQLRPGLNPHATDTGPAHEGNGHIGALRRLGPVMNREEIVALQSRVDEVRLDRSLVDYIIRLANATRAHDEVEIGVSPRGTLALAQSARATALIDGRDYCIPEDVTTNIVAVCAHRIVPRSFVADGRFGGREGASGRIMQTIVESIESPA